MSYRYDPDLEFLKYLQNDDLEELFKVLRYDKDGERRITEHFDLYEKFKENYPDHTKYWDVIAAELQKFGGNSFANLFRGDRGVLYKEILMDVCDKMKVNYNKYASTELIEDNLLQKILKEALDKMSDEDRKELLRELGINSTDFSSEALFGIFQAVFRAGGFKSYQLTVIIVNAIMKALFGRGLSLAGNAMLTRTMGILTGPIGWAITAIWTLIDIAGPAYRVTTPATFIVAYLRKKYKYDNENIENIKL